MDTNGLKKFAQDARNTLRQQVSAKLDQVLADQSGARRAHPFAVQKLEREIAATSRDRVIERVAYVWFNRFTALRYMDASGHLTPMVLSPRAGETRPEILSEAMAGVIGVEVPAVTAQSVRDLLEGRAPSHDPQGEAFQKLVLAACHHWHKTMPFLFEAVDDPTEILMPTDLLAEGSLIAKLRTVMSEEACQDVEIIGWLYQFYISEKKDQVFAGLKKNVKITPENIPAATQLFTPHWIVRYLVENSLGRLWLLNRPGSKLAAQMDYYIAPVEPETDFLKIGKPEEIKICDPACGSGHMLTYAFDLLYAIYEEEGYDPAEIPSLILTHNLYGIEIDDRAGALAAFALTMKAAARRRRFLRTPVQPNICVMENVAFEAQELADYIAVAGRDLFTGPLRDTLGQFAQARNFGALITPKLPDVAEARRVLAAKDFTSDLVRRETHARVLRVLEMAEYLSPRYHVVVANPPYMGGKGMNPVLADFAKGKFPDSKSDLFAMFIERGFGLVHSRAYSAMVTMESWMFLSSYEKMRSKLLEKYTLKSLVHMPYLGKGGTSMGINFGTAGFVTKKYHAPQYKAAFCCVRYYETDDQGVPFVFPPQNERLAAATTEDFEKIPGAPLVYWASRKFVEVYSSLEKFGSRVAKGMDTGGDLPRFTRQWHEVCNRDSNFNFGSSGKWFPYSKGGDFRRWAGNHHFVINYQNNGKALEANGANLRSRERYFRDGLTWGVISSGGFNVRRLPTNSIFDQVGSAIHPKLEDVFSIEGMLAFLNSKFVSNLAKMMSPTITFTAGEIQNYPIWENEGTRLVSKQCQILSRSDWDAYETSWDFTTLPLLATEHRSDTLAATYTALRTHWQSMTDEMQRLEVENNRIFIDAYGLQDELTPDVPLEEISLTCNPAYRYGGKKTPAELDEQLRADAMAEFLHYAVGCMFGRYSLDAPGLILANQGDTLAEYLAKVPAPSFEPDADNVIPMLEGEWFADDITPRFRKFLRVTFGEERFEENLAFIEDALGKDVRKWFVKSFFDYHVRRYKKRPIYWMFSSPKGTFNALIYMHRYTPATVGTVLTDYVRPLRDQLEAHRKQLGRIQSDPDASVAERRAAEKDAPEITRQIAELDDWEREVLLPMAQQRIEIDL
ncbi:MAG: BREX-1 system adenine-specific DNA-methyltransferase PglX, partial [Hyphomonadaceae bacterium]